MSGRLMLKSIKRGNIKQMSTNRRTTSTRIPVAVGRFGSDPEQVTVKANGTVADVLKRAEIVLEEHEHVWLNGGRATLTDKVRKQDIVSIVSPKEAGAF